MAASDVRGVGRIGEAHDSDLRKQLDPVLFVLSLAVHWFKCIALLPAYLGFEAGW